MARRHDHMGEKARRGRYAAALTRPELRGSADRFARIAPAGATSAAIKVVDAETRALIDQTLKDRTNAGEQQ